jgi:2-oxoglutarate ferredoxin oxidoreductase subunit delta
MVANRVYVAVEICKGCGLCISYCPREVLRLAKEPNKKGYAVVEVYQPENCVGCRLCEVNCPDFAIYVNGANEAPASPSKPEERSVARGPKV